MDFGFNPEQKSLGAVVGQMLADFPVAPSPDYAPQTDAAIWNALTELGLFSLLVPEAHDGAGLSLVDLALVVEALGAALVSPLVVHTLLATDLLVRFGSPAQQQALLPPIGAGMLRMALAAQEEASSFGRGQTGMSKGRLNGCKMGIPGADQTDWLLTLCDTAGAPKIVLVDRHAAGVSSRIYESLDPTAGFAEICFQDATGEAIGQSPELQASAVCRLLDVAPALYAGLQTGITARVLDLSVEYAKNRNQFGQPIGAFQAIKHRCADMAVALDVARSAAYYAFWAASEDPPDRGRATSMAKAYCGEVARDACNDAIQIHGGMGFTWDLGLHRFLRRAKVLEQHFGDQAWHYERVLSETLGASP